VRLSAVTAEGREVVVGLLGPGDLFGESALLDRPSPVDARVVEVADVVVMPLDHVRHVLRISPATAEELLRLVASRLHRTACALEEAMTADVRTRVSARLRDLASAHGIAQADGVRIGVPLSREELARMVGASREAVSRTLSRMAATGLVRTHGQTLVIPDPQALVAPSGP
jgi:CRP/FNR family transcriptional regulator